MVLEAALPDACLLCGDLAGTVPNVCGPCTDALPWIAVGCRRCGTPLPVDGLCPRCMGKGASRHSTRAALHYRGAARYLLHALKFHGRLDAGNTLGVALARYLGGGDLIPPQALVPVPLHPSRFRERGFNQATEIARGAGARLGIPVLTGILARRRATAAQTTMATAAARRRNVRDAFRIRRLPPGITRVALVDDVMTTGATTTEGIRVLRRGGVRDVEVWVCARASLEESSS